MRNCRARDDGRSASAIRAWRPRAGGDTGAIDGSAILPRSVVHHGAHDVHSRRMPAARARSSVGQSRRLIIVWSLVRSQPGPPSIPTNIRDVRRARGSAPSGCSPKTHAVHPCRSPITADERRVSVLEPCIERCDAGPFIASCFAPKSLIPRSAISRRPTPRGTASFLCL